MNFSVRGTSQFLQLACLWLLTRLSFDKLEVLEFFSELERLHSDLRETILDLVHDSHRSKRTKFHFIAHNNLARRCSDVLRNVFSFRLRALRFDRLAFTHDAHSSLHRTFNLGDLELRVSLDSHALGAVFNPRDQFLRAFLEIGERAL